MKSMTGYGWGDAVKDGMKVTVELSSVNRKQSEISVNLPRELEVLKLIAEAYTSKQIAAELIISVKTVERHRQNLLDKLGMRDRVDLTRYAIRRGLVEP